MGLVDRSSSGMQSNAGRLVTPGGVVRRQVSPYIDYSDYSFYPPKHQGLRHDERLDLARRQVQLTADIPHLGELVTEVRDSRPSEETIVGLLEERFGEDMAAKVVGVRQFGYIAEAHLRSVLTTLARTRPHLKLDPDPVPPVSKFGGFLIENHGGSVVATNKIATMAEYDAVVLLGDTPVVLECKSRMYDARGLRMLDTALTDPRDFHKLHLIQGIFGEVPIGFGMMIPDTVSDRAAESIRRVERKGAFVCPFPVGYYREMFGLR